MSNSKTRLISLIVFKVHPSLHCHQKMSFISRTLLLSALLVGLTIAHPVNRGPVLNKLGYSDAATAYQQGQQAAFASHPWTLPGSVPPNGFESIPPSATTRVIPSMEQGRAWGLNNWRCEGYTVSSVVGGTYSAPVPEPDMVEDFPQFSIWYYATSFYWQYINADGCWTNQGGLFQIANCNYATQIAGQADTATDVSSVKGFKKMMAQDWDVTSCGCPMVSFATFLDLTVPGSLNQLQINNTRHSNLDGVVLFEWPFMQLYSVNVCSLLFLGFLLLHSLSP